MRAAYLIPLLIPFVYSLILQDCFLFPKEILFIAAAGIVTLLRAPRLIYKNAPAPAAFHAGDAAVVGLVALAALSIHRAPNFYVPLPSLVLVLSFVAIYYELRIYWSRWRVFGAFTDAFIAASAVPAIFAMAQYYGFDSIFEPTSGGDKMRMFSFFGNKNYLSEYLALLLFVTFSKIAVMLAVPRLATLSRRFALRLSLYSISAILTAAVLFIIQSRASYLAVAAASLYLALMLWRAGAITAIVRRHSRFIAIFAIAIVAVIAIFSIRTPITRETTDILQRITSAFDPSERNAAIRLDIWHATVRMIRDNFWLGCGLSYFKVHYLTYQGSLMREGNTRYLENNFFAKANQAHNEYLQVFCELGVFAFAALIFMVFFHFVSVWRLVAARRGAFGADAGGGSAPGTVTEIEAATKNVRKHPRVEPAKVVVSCLSAGFLTIAVNSLFGFPIHVVPTAALLMSVIAIVDKFTLAAAARDKMRLPGFFEYTIEPRRPNVALILASAMLFYAAVFAAMPPFLVANMNMKAGLDCLKLGMPEKAYPYLKNAIRINPYGGDARYYLGLCHLNRKEYDLGIMEMLQSLGTESDPNIFSNIGIAFYRIGMYKEALEYLKKAIDIAPNDIYYLLNAGCAEQKLGNFNGATAYFQKALSFAVTPEAFINLGHSYYLMNMPEKAVEVLESALQKFGRARPAYAERIYYLLGLCNGELKKYADAISFLTRARDIDPENADYAINIGLYQILSGKTAEAELTLSNALSKQFNELAAYNLGNLYYNSGKKQDAITTLNRVRSALEGRGERTGQLYTETVKLLETIYRQK